MSEIIAPIPDRHLLHSQQSQQWLYSPSSPSSSRAVSPTSRTFGHTSSNRSSRHLSFSTLMVHERLRRSSQSGSYTVLRNEVQAESKVTLVGDHSMGRRWIRWMHKNGLKEWVIPSAIVASIWIRWGISLGSYSGEFTKNSCLLKSGF